jgi:hypothetical protein
MHYSGLQILPLKDNLVHDISIEIKYSKFATHYLLHRLLHFQ